MTIHGMHQIGEAAEAVGLSLRTIRHWDEVGVAPPSGRSAGGFRLYTDDDIERLRLAKALKPLDLSLDQMRDLLETRSSLREALDETERARLVDRLAMFSSLADERCSRLHQQLDQVEEVARLLQRECGRPAVER
ncbi:MAG: cueR1 [Acidimicrobiales bacterium]|nr:cueR1 [Acidimicrobiales bacterium]